MVAGNDIIFVINNGTVYTRDVPILFFPITDLAYWPIPITNPLPVKSNKKKKTHIIIILTLLSWLYDLPQFKPLTGTNKHSTESVLRMCKSKKEKETKKKEARWFTH